MKLFLSDCIFTASEQYSKPISGFVLENAGRVVLVEQGEPPQHFKNFADEIIDAKGKVIVPGFIDAHTHLVHAGSRENELALKQAGKTYLEIHESGGGIASSVRATRNASEKELTDKALKTLRTMLAHGTTTIEAKSGYGLDLETELKCLKVARHLSEMQPIEIVSTYMGAHSIPPEYQTADEYIDFMITDVLPEIKNQGIAEFVDIFCEQGIFSVEQSERFLQAAKKLGFQVKIHADEIIPLGGAELAAKLHAISAEHLMAISEQGIVDLAASGTIAVLLPATSFFLMVKNYAPAQQMLDKGVKIAIATDYNPGSSPTGNIQQAMWNACYGMKLQAEDIFRAVTINAAKAINREKNIGSLEKGKQADILILDVPNLEQALYYFGINHVESVWKKGTRVYERPDL
ncbi:MAG: imidazolonepropionase [Spirochaetaceae bacterium]|nr:imidazolonepropionase [Spirochaetaceae bacterium]